MTAEPLVEVRAVPGKGRGVFLRVPVPAGTVLETAPVLELPGVDIERITGTVVDDYYFAHPTDPDGGCLVFGHASLLNHSAQPNVELRWERRGEAGWFVSVVALSDLPAGTELLYRYRCPPWFEVVELGFGPAGTTSAGPRGRGRRRPPAARSRRRGASGSAGGDWLQ